MARRRLEITRGRYYTTRDFPYIKPESFKLVFAVEPQELIPCAGTPICEIKTRDNRAKSRAANTGGGGGRACNVTIRFPIGEDLSPSSRDRRALTTPRNYTVKDELGEKELESCPPTGYTLFVVYLHTVPDNTVITRITPRLSRPTRRLSRRYNIYTPRLQARTARSYGRHPRIPYNPVNSVRNYRPYVISPARKQTNKKKNT